MRTKQRLECAEILYFYLLAVMVINIDLNNYKFLHNITIINVYKWKARMYMILYAQLVQQFRKIHNHKIIILQSVISELHTFMHLSTL